MQVSFYICCVAFDNQQMLEAAFHLRHFYLVSNSQLLLKIDNVYHRGMYNQQLFLSFHHLTLKSSRQVIFEFQLFIFRICSFKFSHSLLMLNLHIGQSGNFKNRRILNWCLSRLLPFESHWCPIVIELRRYTKHKSLLTLYCSKISKTNHLLGGNCTDDGDQHLPIVKSVSHRFDIAIFFSFVE